MTRRMFFVACSVISLAPSTFAQPPDTKADALSGTWTGEFIRLDRPSPVAVTMELKFDGKTSVSGTLDGLPEPGDVKSGTFDPQTGVLKLELGIKGDPAVLITLEGTVVNGKATGRITSRDETGEFKLGKK